MKIMPSFKASHFSGAENVVCQIFNLLKMTKMLKWYIAVRMAR